MSTEAGGANVWGVSGGQRPVERLRRAIAEGQLAHAYLFSGPDGVGKGMLATRLAQALTCDQAADGVPCLECRHCRAVEAGESPDIERVRIGGACDDSGHADHASDGSTRIRICQIRRLERLAALAPFAAARRIFIVDPADALQIEAAHALLKTLEEPPGSALLLLLATDAAALLPTVRSRCQEMPLRPMPAGELADALVAGHGLEAAEAAALARLARGRYGLAMRVLGDPSVRVLRESVMEDVARLLLAGRNERFDYAETLAGRWAREREAVLATLDLWREWCRDALLAASGVVREGVMRDDGSGDGALRLEAGEALRALQAVQRAREHLLQNTNAQLALEVMMLDLPVLDGKEARGPATSPATAMARRGTD